ncbi:ADP-ribosyl cyclase/cyclic ADP-ribose hydrolase [Citrus sinensis]|uniref:ADP-ribosyl cyclase/cyclic ADP-ribose hydrolase n=1 Tax=Citrus sinensis TaxID=2711 RepID=A0ACB8M8T7_CITSI|nr:ADP-ribosyl cyclase/cyclic ADP-ribose hydrolase [Citrus sinensis]
MKFKLKTSDHMPPVTIQTNDDVEFFLEEVASGMEFRNPLCITFERISISTVPVDRQPSPRPSWEESHAFSSYVPPSFPILSNNFTIADESPIECLPTTQPTDEQEAVNEFVTGADCLDEPPLAVDSTLGDNTPATISSRTSNNAHVPRINLLASSSNLLSIEISGDTDVSMVKEMTTANGAFCASRLKGCNMFEIRKYYNVHTCSLDSQEKEHRQTSSKLVGQNFQHKFDGASSSYKPADIRQDFQKEFGYEISYHKVWRAREFAMEMVRVTPADSYHLLPSHVIAVDGTFMKGKYKGTLFIATSLDGNNQLYPVAFGVDDIDVGALFELAAKAYQPIKFTQYMNDIRSVSLNVHQYLTDAGYEKCACSHFKGRRYGIMTTNIAERSDVLSLNFIVILNSEVSISITSAIFSTNAAYVVDRGVPTAIPSEDTRDNFTSHLYSALSQKSIETFINRGDEISQSLVDAIEASAISLIIFSEGYASSRWFFDKLVKILQCKRVYGQIVLPVFYGVDPAPVKWPTGSYGDSFLKLEERFKENSEKLQTWRNALKEVAGLSGFHSQNIRPESELVKEVVNQILKRLAEMSPCSNKNQLVGVESRVEEIESLLVTLEESQRPGGLGCLQQKLLSKLLQDDNVIPDIALSFKRLSRRKVLIVLDDVTCFRQIKSLIGSLDWCMAESRIIKTTRNQQVLRNCCVKEKYEMKELGDDHALELFSRHAFKQNNPHIGFEELSSRVIQYAQGVPLATEILGCFLFEKEKQFWESAINILKRIPNMEIQKVLKISFDGLDDEKKNIVLDIACFFKWKNKDLVIKFLNACGFTAQTGISSLVDKSLICMHSNNITMHDLLQEMGREIVRQESTNDPAKRSWLWHHEDIIKVITSNTKIISACNIFTKTPNPSFSQHLNTLVVLNLRDCKSLKSLPAGIHLEFLKELDLSGCSKLKRLPDISSAANIEEMFLNGTAIEELPSSIECLYKLLHLDLEDCKSLKSLPSGLCKLKSLKYLTLNGCSILQRLNFDIWSILPLVLTTFIYVYKFFVETSAASGDDWKSAFDAAADGPVKPSQLLSFCIQLS